MKSNASRALAALCLGAVVLNPAGPAPATALAPLGKPIACNSAVDGQVSSAAYVEEWSFQGAAGQRVGVNAFSQTGPVSVQLVQGNSVQELKSDLGRFPGDSGVVAALAASDTYTVAVFGPAPGRSSYTMQYQLALRCSTGSGDLPPLSSLGGGLTAGSSGSGSGATASGTGSAGTPTAPAASPAAFAMPSPVDPSAASVVPAAPGPSVATPTAAVTAPQALAAQPTVTNTVGVTGTNGVTGTTGITPTATATITPTAGFIVATPTASATVVVTAPVTPTTGLTGTTGVTGTTGITPTTDLTGTTGISGTSGTLPPVTVSPPETSPTPTVAVKYTLPFTIGSFIRWEGLYQDVQGSAQNRNIDTRQDYLAAGDPSRLRVRNTLTVWAPGLADQKQTDAYEVQIDAVTGELVDGEQFIYTYLPQTLDIAVGKEFDGQGGQWRVSAEKQQTVLGKNLNVWIVTNRDQRDFFQPAPAQGAPANKRFIPKDGIQLYYDQATRMYLGGQITQVLQNPLGQQIGQSLESHNLAETSINLGVYPPLTGMVP